MYSLARLFAAIILTYIWVPVASGQIAPLGPAKYCGVQSFATPNPQGASATIWNGQPVILVDPSSLGTGPWAHFVAAHECAHHVLGHTLPQGMWFRNTQYWATGVQELQADCWAAQRVGQYAADAVSRMFYHGQGHHSGGPGYPTGVQRATRIRQCAGLP